jgi:hypothetical protein
LAKWPPYDATATGYDILYKLREHRYRVRVVAFDATQNPTTGAAMFKRVTVFSIYAPRGYTVTAY